MLEVIGYIAVFGLIFGFGYWIGYNKGWDKGADFMSMPFGRKQ